ncbi:hypothetical protein HJFPF1_05293 [Paramyrothecium foliicola]|nr:hypothetical protein HJFPF1_05293 [Paramyrothecium foliicola]
METMESKFQAQTYTEPVEAMEKKPPAKAPLAAALLWACITGWACLALNLAWTVWAVVQHPADKSLVGVLFEGSCSKTSRLSMWLHLLINVLSTALLAASNYCMQVSLAPTREDIDAAHSQRKVLSIGTPSMRNLGRTSSLRASIWLLLAFGSVPLHLFFNSAIFSAITVSEYAFAMTDESFFTERPLWNVNASRTLTQFARSPFNSSAVQGWDRLDPAECLAAYGKEFVTDRRNVLVVVDGEDRVLDKNYEFVDTTNPRRPIPDPLGEHRLEGGYRAFTSGVWSYLAAKHYDWLCFGMLQPAAVTGLAERPGVENLPASTESQSVHVCNPKLLQQMDDKWRIANLPYDYTVKYCLSEPREESCRLEYSPVMLGIICAANLLKALMITLLFLTHRNSSPLLTLGDAITSFLNRSDATTASRCTWTKHDFKTERRWNEPVTPRPLKAVRRRYGAVPSRLRWFLTVTSFIAALGLLIALLAQGITGDARDASIKVGDLWDRGFGTINTISLIGKGRGGHESWRRSTLSMVILANTPQLLLSILYYSYNALFTAMWAGAEWANLGSQVNMATRKTLRVSKPRENQRGSYYLQLPFKISIPLIVLSVILHWLTSQSLFLAKVGGTDSHGGNSQNFITTCGYSNIAIIFGIAVGGLALLLLLGAAALPLSSNIPIVGSSSAAISASCHPLAKNVDPYRDTIGWGVESEVADSGHRDGQTESQPLHCSLTSRETRGSANGEVYA